MKKPRPDEGIIALSSYTTIIKKSIKIMYFKTDPLQNILSHEKRNTVFVFSNTFRLHKWLSRFIQGQFLLFNKL